jgi:hypothetical protein
MMSGGRRHKDQEVVAEGPLRSSDDRVRRQQERGLRAAGESHAFHQTFFSAGIYGKN